MCRPSTRQPTRGPDKKARRVGENNIRSNQIPAISCRQELQLSLPSLACFGFPHFPSPADLGLRRHHLVRLLDQLFHLGPGQNIQALEATPICSGLGRAPGIMSSCSTNSANFSGVHLNINRCGTELRDSRAKIFPPTLKQRSSPHCRFSVACGKERQKRRMDSTLMVTVHLKMSAWHDFAEVEADSTAADEIRWRCYTCSRASPRVTLTSIFFLPRKIVIRTVSPAR